MSKEFDQIAFAYNLATQGNKIPVVVKTSRTNDTIFTYHYKPIKIQPIPVATIVSGNCLGVYDVNYKRNYSDKIRLWFFNHNMAPDPALIEEMNSLLMQFNYSGYNEYSAVSGSIPVVTSLQNYQYRIASNIKGSYFYLYACQSGNSIMQFVESKISHGLKDAKRSPDDVFTCSNKGFPGTNTLFLIAIDENWKYDVLPIGLIAIDDVAPNIIPMGYKPDKSIISWDLLKHAYSTASTDNKPLPENLYVEKNRILVHMPQPPISSSVTISYGHFEGHEYYGYNIPFYINIVGDVQSLTIGNHKLEANNIRNNECVRLHFKNLHIGDNNLLLSATDSRGNKSTASLSIPIVSIRNNKENFDDYDDLENRISDLESRMDDLE